jgi:type IV pilus assembly protein PilO
VINLQEDSQRVPAALLQRIWFFAPIVAGAAIAAVLMGAVLVPMGVQLNKDRERVAELEALQSQVVLLRRELSTLEENRDQAQRQRGVLINLLAGNRDIVTFLAQLEKEANASGVTLRLFEPQAPAPAPAPGQPGQPPGGAGQPAAGQPPAGQPAAPGQPGQAAPPTDLLALEGLERRQLLLQAQGPYPNLVAFLRRIEKLDVLVGQDTLNLQVEPLPVEALKAGSRVAQPKVSLRQSLLLYNKKPTPPPQPGTPTAAAAPGATPAPVPGAPPAAGSQAPPG